MSHHVTRRPAQTVLSGVMLALSLILASPGAASAAPRTGPDASPVVHNDSSARVVSKITGTTEDGRRVLGSFTPTSFDVVGDTLEVTGDLSGRIPGEGAFSETVTMAVESVNGTTLTDAGVSSRMVSGAAAGTCDILHLVLGPLDLDLLGLQVHLDQVVLDIVAKRGPGNLLGNLLCAVAGLLDDGLDLGALLGQLGNLLNQLLEELGLV